MTPRLRLPRADTRPPGPVRLTPARPLLARLLLVLAAVLLPCGTAVAHAPEPLPSDSASASATPEPSLAGTLAGEGMTRPGRPQGPATKVEGQVADDPDDSADPGVSSTPGDSSAAAHAAAPADPADPDDSDDPDFSDDSDDSDEATATESAVSGAGSPAATSSAPPSREAVLAPSAPQPHPDAGQAMGPGQEDDTEPVRDILPLGSGLVLIGVGLGLAFAGLRVRRG
ncbi:hypothetical protein [Streptomyces shenzhenensis]|uniref:hypothetical protein n=1 Tax=Streptomyces shenzhenensis TaxID=943815 RepID=UPI001F24BF14|nr:hypothetical protein [Streptomyces shenzhenensis]